MIKGRGVARFRCAVNTMADEIETPQKEVEFKYLLRIAASDIKGERPIRQGLTAIRGIGTRVSEAICRLAGVPGSKLGGELTDDEVARITESLESFPETAPEWMFNRQRDPESGDEIHLYGQDLKIIHSEDIAEERRLKSYRGIRHASRQKVRGQRSRSNGRFGATLGVSRKR